MTLAVLYQDALGPDRLEGAIDILLELVAAYCLGEVEIEEKPLTPGQESGRLVAWIFLILAFFLVLAAASALGWLR